MTETQSGTQEQADLFRLLVDTVMDYAIFLLDPSGCVLSWNEGARRIKGYTPDEIIGKHFSIFYPPKDIRHGKPDYGLRIAADEGRWQEEGWRIRKDGTQFWASVVLTALHDTSGNLIGFAKVTRDLTERKRAEEERAQLLELEHTARTQSESMVTRLEVIQGVTEAALAHLNLDSLLAALLDRIAESLEVDTVAVLLLEHAPDGAVLVARAAKGIEEEVEQGVRIPVGRGFAGRIAAERRPVIIDDVQHADVSNPILLQKRIQSLVGVPLIVGGSVIGVLHVGSLHRRQFTERDVQLLQIVGDRVSLALEHARLIENAQMARQEANIAEATLRAQDEFLTIAAHELKTPLTALTLSSQSLLRRLERDESVDPTVLEHSVRTVERQSARLSRLVTQLLETVRYQSGRLGLDCDRVDLRELVRSTVEQWERQTDAHHFVVHALEPVWCEIDPVRFDQVLVNLLDNAVKYSPHGGPIDVDVERDAGGRVRLAVRDRGIGIPVEHRDHIFERFYQAHRTDHRSGMGLGLYLSREIVEMHEGRLEVEFPDDGGSRFVVLLPKVRSPEFSNGSTSIRN